MEVKKNDSAAIIEIKYLPENFSFGFEKVWLLSRHKQMEITLLLSDKNTESGKKVLGDFYGTRDDVKGTTTC